MMTVRYNRATAPAALGDTRAAKERWLWQHYWTAAPATATAIATIGVPATTTGSTTSGSDCSADSTPELADLVNSFYNGDDSSYGVPPTVVAIKTDKDVLEELLSGESEADDGEAVFITRRIKREAAAALKSAVKAVAGKNNTGWDWDEATTDDIAVIKRKVMWTLRQRGFDAGLCKSRPDAETCRFPTGTGHDYIDVLVGDDDGGSSLGLRYIVELCLASEFGIARPTGHYASLLEVFPRVFVGKPKALKGVVGIMCAGAAKSLKSQGMYVAPWRRREYVMAKWFGPYKRSTSRVPSSSSSSSSSVSSAASSSSSTSTKMPAPKEEEPGTAGVVLMGIGGKAGYCKEMFGCREEKWDRRSSLVGLSGMYL